MMCVVLGERCYKSYSSQMVDPRSGSGPGLEASSPSVLNVSKYTPQNKRSFRSFGQNLPLRRPHAGRLKMRASSWLTRPHDDIPC